MPQLLMIGLIVIVVNSISSLLVSISSGSLIFNPEENHPVALLQLCVGRRCLLFQLLHKDAIPRFLVDFLMDPNFKFVGVRVKRDAEKLLRDHKMFVANTVDLNQLALSIYREEVYGKLGLKRMAKEVLGKVMEKPLNVTLSKWDAEELAYEQVEYAAIDAFVLFEIRKNLFNSMWERQREIDNTIAECVGNVIQRIFNWKVVGIKVKYEKFMGGMFSKFVYNNLRPTREEVQRLDLTMIEGIELNDADSAFSHDTSINRSGKRHFVDIHTHSNTDHQGFNDFSTVLPPKILRKTGLSVDASTSQPIKRRRTIHLVVRTVDMQ
ncbi:hypothetical protein T459_23394 [Capsicum annuum]|uniref:3'-5' exonuclease domain-containing protein n=1 Tax=Capsicum annuum TaxID=4072 RepID=A0A2G2YS92_CAPAN|nr:hypothetical protein T459_23394 [Capsicum annuum]